MLGGRQMGGLTRRFLRSKQIKDYFSEAAVASVKEVYLTVARPAYLNIETLAHQNLVDAQILALQNAVQELAEAGFQNEDEVIALIEDRLSDYPPMEGFWNVASNGDRTVKTDDAADAVKTLEDKVDTVADTVDTVKDTVDTVKSTATTLAEAVASGFTVAAAASAAAEASAGVAATIGSSAGTAAAAAMAAIVLIEIQLAAAPFATRSYVNTTFESYYTKTETDDLFETQNGSLENITNNLETTTTKLDDYKTALLTTEEIVAKVKVVADDLVAHYKTTALTTEQITAAVKVVSDNLLANYTKTNDLQSAAVLGSMTIQNIWDAVVQADALNNTTFGTLQTTVNQVKAQTDYDRSVVWTNFMNNEFTPVRNLAQSAATIYQPKLVLPLATDSDPLLPAPLTLSDYLFRAAAREVVARTDLDTVMDEVDVLLAKDIVIQANLSSMWETYEPKLNFPLVRLNPDETLFANDVSTLNDTLMLYRAEMSTAESRADLMDTQVHQIHHHRLLTLEEEVYVKVANPLNYGIGYDDVPMREFLGLDAVQPENAPTPFYTKAQVDAAVSLATTIPISEGVTAPIGIIGFLNTGAAAPTYMTKAQVDAALVPFLKIDSVTGYIDNRIHLASQYDDVKTAGATISGKISAAVAVVANNLANNYTNTAGLPAKIALGFDVPANYEKLIDNGLQSTQGAFLSFATPAGVGGQIAAALTADTTFFRKDKVGIDVVTPAQFTTNLNSTLTSYPTITAMNNAITAAGTGLKYGWVFVGDPGAVVVSGAIVAPTTLSVGSCAGFITSATVTQFPNGFYDYAYSKVTVNFASLPGIKYVPILTLEDLKFPGDSAYSGAYTIPVVHSGGISGTSSCTFQVADQRAGGGDGLQYNLCLKVHICFQATQLLTV